MLSEAKMLLAGMKDPHLHDIHFVPRGNEREAWKRWGKMGNRPIINTCGAENESCLQSDLGSYSPVMDLFFTWLQLDS